MSTKTVVCSLLILVATAGLLVLAIQQHQSRKAAKVERVTDELNTINQTLQETEARKAELRQELDANDNAAENSRAVMERYRAFNAEFAELLRRQRTAEQRKRELEVKLEQMKK